ncbi:MAG: sugar ABC transporter ATP-binding protein [Treponema sp.]|nr:sugar ABC transporter ATP-binding protein [Treponema sp.]
MSDVLVRTSGISKEFSSVRVLDDISIEIRKGEILGIIGENGAGKSTFIKILSGIYTPTQGSIEFDGRRVELRDAAAAKRIGVSLIPQEFNLVETLNVYENIFLGEELRTRGGLLDRRGMIAHTRELMKELGAAVDPSASIRTLSVAQKQMVEIAKAIKIESRLLIMDEPTTVLTVHEIDILFALMRRLKGKGVTIVYISHKLKEVRSVCDRVMVLRDGRFICLETTDALEIDEMARRMVGRELNQIFPPKRKAEGEVAFRVEGLAVPGLVAGLSFEIRSGEILGFAGLIGAGRTELAEAIMGIRRVSAGRIFVGGRELRIRKPADAVKAGIAYLSEDRQGAGIITSFAVHKNVTLVSLGDYARPLISRAKELEKTRFYVDRFEIKAPSLDARLENLSGGNQQKVSLAKSLDTDPKVLIVDEPTRGVDVKAKHDIYAFIRELADRGLAVMFISSELEEVMGMCERIVVMREGRAAGQVEGGHITEEEIMYYAMGIKEGV